jgi:hypothetical protein
MHADFQELLAVRDGSPVDHRVEEHIASCAHCSFELTRLVRLKHDLRQLPQFDPPAGLWRAIRAGLDARPAARAPSRLWRVATGGLAATLAIALLVRLESGHPSTQAGGAAARAGDRPAWVGGGLAQAGGTPAQARSTAAQAGGTPAQVAGSPATAGGATASASLAPQGGSAVAGAPGTSAQAESLGTLISRSQRLEALLQVLPPRPGVERVTTSAAIDALQTRIQLVDLELSGAARGDAERARRLWSTRVELLNSLVNVRCAEAARAHPGFGDPSEFGVI